MAKKKMTILDFQKFKDEGRKFAFCTAYDYTTATIVDESDVEIILVGDSLGMIMLGYDTTVPVTVDDMIHHIKPVVKGAPNTFIIGDMPFGSYNVSPEQAIETANRLTKETLCDCVKLEGGVNMAPTIRRMVDAGINVMGHIGMTPQTATSFGGFKVQGGTPESARKLIEDAKALEKAGVFSMVVECVPSVVAKAMQEEVHVPILGIGAGPYVDCQVLVTQDLLGMYGDFKPKFVKQFANVRKVMVDGLNKFHEETLSGEFPTPERPAARFVFRRLPALVAVPAAVAGAGGHHAGGAVAELHELQRVEVPGDVPALVRLEDDEIVVPDAVEDALPGDGVLGPHQEGGHHVMAQVLAQKPLDGALIGLLGGHGGLQGILGEAGGEVQRAPAGVLHGRDALNDALGTARHAAGDPLLIAVDRLLAHHHRGIPRLGGQGLDAAILAALLEAGLIAALVARLVAAHAALQTREGAALPRGGGLIHRPAELSGPVLADGPGPLG